MRFHRPSWDCRYDAFRLVHVDSVGYRDASPSESALVDCAAAGNLSAARCVLRVRIPIMELSISSEEMIERIEWPLLDCIRIFTSLMFLSAVTLLVTGCGSPKS